MPRSKDKRSEKYVIPLFPFVSCFKHISLFGRFGITMHSFLKNKINLAKISAMICGSLARMSTAVISKNDIDCEVREHDGSPVEVEGLSSGSSKVKLAYKVAFSSTKKVVMPATRDMVDSLIASDTVVIFSKTYCPYCKMAKEVFDQLQKKYTAIELDKRDDADDIQSILGEITGARTVPRVFVKGECLGGGTDVKKMFESGELVKKF